MITKDSNFKKTDTLIFIGGIEIGRIPTGGETAKNQNLLNHFRNCYKKVMICDTAMWRKNPLIVIKILFQLAIHPKTTVFISASARSVDLLMKLIPNSRLRRNVYYSTIGGVFHELVQRREIDVAKLQNLRRIIVETNEMKQSLEKYGLNNVIRIPNVKYIEHYPKLKNKKESDKVHFVFLSRVTEFKGCNVIFDSVAKLIDIGYADMFDVTFYGIIDSNYKNEFERRIAKTSLCHYAGVIDLSKQANYGVLSTYDVMLFPTFWPGEGFPGVIIDAFVSALPIIATDWHHNSEIVTNNINGILITPNNSIALAEAMRYMIENNDEVKRMSIESQKEAKKYDIRHVYSVEFMKEVGMLY